MEQPVSLPGQPDLYLVTPEEASWKQGSYPTCPDILNTQQGMGQQTLVVEINGLLCLDAAHN